MIKILIDKIGEYKKETILTPLFMVGEVALECIIPTVMAMLIDEMTGESLMPVIKYGSILLVLALFSLLCGASSARHGAKASTGFAKNLRKDLFYKVQEFSLFPRDLFEKNRRSVKIEGTDLKKTAALKAAVFSYGEDISLISDRT